MSDAFFIRDAAHDGRLSRKVVPSGLLADVVGDVT